MKEALDRVDGCMQMLGSSLNILDPNGTLKSNPPQMPSMELLIEVVAAVSEDYRNLSDAILALREEAIMIDDAMKAVQDARQTCERWNMQREKILAVKRRAAEDFARSPESNWTLILSQALVDIESCCTATQEVK
jgi:hypothetical protein